MNRLTGRIKSFQLFFKSGIAILDQALLSVSNFAVTILIIKYLPKTDYGNYSIAYSFVFYLMSLQNALVNTPFTVQYAGKSETGKKQYVHALFWGQFFVLLPLLLLYFMILLLVQAVTGEFATLDLYLCLGLAAAGILLREFLKSYLYTIEKERDVLKLDVLFLGFLAVFVGLQYGLNRLGVAWIMAGIGLASLLASLFFIGEIGRRSDKKSVAEAFRENWRYGRWSLLGVSSSHVQAYGHYYLLGLLLGTGAVAEINASRLLLMPFALLITGWGRVSRPYGARLREANRIRKYYKELVLISIGLAGGVFLYSFVVNLLSGPLTQLFFRDEYQHVFQFLFYWSATYAMQFFRYNASFGLQVVKEFHRLALVNLMTMVLTLVLAWIGIQALGIRGALLAGFAGELVFALILWILLTRTLYRDGEIKGRIWKKAVAISSTLGTDR